MLWLHTDQQSIEEFGIFIESDVAAFEPVGGLYFR